MHNSSAVNIQMALDEEITLLIPLWPRRGPVRDEFLGCNFFSGMLFTVPIFFLHDFQLKKHLFYLDITENNIFGAADGR